ncbi:interleukin 31 [Phyllostomus discolor]|uniref:Interleukin-31 n=1 Tax=Phyllostomus discolor TaxID=89673 RepID=A0A6J2MVA1_9CHIR|nr:interleukin-31 [Phyllostomus discolor]KAF6081478.1 interleukin 31 [Phyllostomus discolor]
MVSPTGPTGLALFLFCCSGLWLAVHTAPATDSLCQTIIKELKGLYEEILKVQEDEVGLPASPYQLPSLTHCCQPPRVNGSAILPYIQAIKPHVTNATVIGQVEEQLVKIKNHCEGGPDAPLPTVPSKPFERKWFISGVLRELSANLKSS